MPSAQLCLTSYPNLFWLRKDFVKTINLKFQGYIFNSCKNLRTIFRVKFASSSTLNDIQSDIKNIHQAVNFFIDLGAKKGPCRTMMGKNLKVKS